MLEDEINKYEIHRMKHQVWNERAWNQKDQFAGMNWKICKYTEWILEYELKGMKSNSMAWGIWIQKYEKVKMINIGWNERSRCSRGWQRKYDMRRPKNKGWFCKVEIYKM